MNLYFLLPAIRVHTWGGFGSQLFTAHLMLNLKQTFPSRRLCAVNHTGGVTRRISEFDFASINVKMIQVDDFKSNPNPSVRSRISHKKSQNLVQSFRLLTIRCLKKFKFVVDANNDQSYNSIKPWTITIRGHYTNLKLKREIVEDLYGQIFDSLYSLKESPSNAVIHYRLGDLITLKQKSPIATHRIETIISKVISKDSNVLILTDSSASEYSKFVAGTKYLAKYHSHTLDPKSTLRKCVEAPIFIGSTAKLSLWAAIFRQFKFERTSYLPNELEWAFDSGVNAFWY